MEKKSNLTDILLQIKKDRLELYNHFNFIFFENAKEVFVIVLGNKRFCSTYDANVHNGDNVYFQCYAIHFQ